VSLKGRRGRSGIVRYFLFLLLFLSLVLQTMRFLLVLPSVNLRGAAFLYYSFLTLVSAPSLVTQNTCFFVPPPFGNVFPIPSTSFQRHRSWTKGHFLPPNAQRGAPPLLVRNCDADEVSGSLSPPRFVFPGTFSRQSAVPSAESTYQGGMF